MKSTSYAMITLFCTIIHSTYSQNITTESFQKTNQLKNGAASIEFSSPVAGSPEITWEDVSESGKPIDHVDIAGLKLGTRILSGSKFILRPNAISEWSYDCGFRVFHSASRDLSISEKLQIYPYNKLYVDPYKQSFGRWVKDGFQCRLYLDPKHPILSYPLDFGPDFKIENLNVKLWSTDNIDGTGRLGTCKWIKPTKNDELEIEISLSSDAVGFKKVASKILDFKELTQMGGIGSFTFPVSEMSKIYVHIRLLKGSMALFAGTDLSAQLRFCGKDWPQIKKDDNKLSYSEGKNGATGERSITFSLNSGYRWQDFGKDSSTIQLTRCISNYVTKQDAENSYILNNGYLKISPELKEKDWYFNIEVPENIHDWSTIKAIRVAYRIKGHNYSVYLRGRGLVNGKMSALFFSKHPLIRAGEPATTWKHAETHLPLNTESRKNAKKLVIHGRNLAKPTGTEYTLEIGALELVPYAKGEKEQLQETQELALNYQEANKNSKILQRLQKASLKTGDAPKLKTIFARGIWGFPLSANSAMLKQSDCHDKWQLIEKRLDDLKAHHCNALHVRADSVPMEDFTNFVKLATEKGFYIWAFLPYARKVKGAKNTIDPKKEEIQLDRFRNYLTMFRNCPSIIAWAPAEEPYRFLLPFLQKTREIINEMEAQPYVVIYHDGGVMQQDAKIAPLPGGVSMDAYPYMRFAIKENRYIEYLEAAKQSADDCKGVAWMVPQMQGNSDGRQPFTTPTEGQMRFQIWSAVAKGITGFFPWHYQEAKNNDLTDKEQFTFYGNEMARIEALEPFLLNLKQIKDATHLTADQPTKAIIGSFTTTGKSTYKVYIVVNRNSKESQSIKLTCQNPKDKLFEITIKNSELQVNKVANNTLQFKAGDCRIFMASPELPKLERDNK